MIHIPFHDGDTVTASLIKHQLDLILSLDCLGPSGLCGLQSLLEQASDLIEDGDKRAAQTCLEQANTIPCQSVDDCGRRAAIRRLCSALKHSLFLQDVGGPFCMVRDPDSSDRPILSTVVSRCMNVHQDDGTKG